MGRWEPDARGRLARAAMDLFHEQGYEKTTVAQIAQRAGLTERSFYRHFADKRDVISAGQPQLEMAIAEAVAALSPETGPWAAARSAVIAAASVIEAGGVTAARRRRRVIQANPELQERELLKGARLASVVGDALVRRGADRVTATMVGQIAVIAFSTAYGEWGRSRRPDAGSLTGLVEEAFRSVADAAEGP